MGAAELPGLDGTAGTGSSTQILRGFDLEGGEWMAKAGMLTRRQFVGMAAAFGLGPELFAHSGNSKKLLSTVSVDGANSLRAHAESAGIRIGCAVVPELLELAGESGAGTDRLYTQTVKKQANILVAENSMKWSSLRPSPAEFSFRSADRLMTFAAQNGQAVRGHNLCWHEQLPGWFASTATKENAESILTTHIQTVAGRYAGRVHSWDVVNEAIHVPDGRADGLRKSSWLDLIGPDYIEIAFAAAAKADPNAKLTYNDFDIELDTPEQSAKRGQVLLLVRRLHARGVPIHAVGIQSHLQANGPQPGQGIVGFLREITQMGLEAYITELDVNSRALPGGPELQEEAVAKVYKDYLNLVLRETDVRTVLTWGITDAHTWLNQSRQPWALRADGARQRPLPFDDQCVPAPAFFAMRNAIDAGRKVAPPVESPAQPPVSGDPFAPFSVPGSPTLPTSAPKN